MSRPVCSAVIPLEALQTATTTPMTTTVSEPDDRLVAD
jgi:hypothetical protein